MGTTKSFRFLRLEKYLAIHFESIEFKPHNGQPKLLEQQTKFTTTKNLQLQNFWLTVYGLIFKLAS